MNDPFKVSINGSDGDIGQDRTPLGVRYPIAHPIIKKNSITVGTVETSEAN